MNDNEFWIKFWKVFLTGASSVLITLILTIAIYSHNQDVMYYDAWTKCLESGGTPTKEIVSGTAYVTFTCARDK